MVRSTVVLLAILLLSSVPTVVATAEPAKPRIAVFPLAGDAAADVREKVGFSIRSKFATDGTYESIDGVTMAEAVADGAAVTLAARPEDLRRLIDHEKPAVLIWGELVGGTPTSVAGATIRLKVLDLRQAGAQPTDVVKKLADPTDLRFAVEEIVQTVAGVGPIRRPNENEVIDDETSSRSGPRTPT